MVLEGSRFRLPPTDGSCNRRLIDRVVFFFLGNEDEDEDEEDEDASSDDSDGEAFDSVTVDLDFAQPEEGDFLGLKTLLTNYLDGEKYDSSGLADLVLKHVW